jgi:uncharacterized protein (TIGR03437 family)
MRNKHKVLIKLLLILSTLPVLILAYEYGPPPAVTGAPGDQTCIQSGCHQGTPNSGPGNVKILLPAGNTGTYTPGQTMQIMVQITDTTKRSYGFELTARSGSGFLTQAGDFSTADANTQVICSPTGSMKANGTTCPAAAPDEYIEHTETGWMDSIAGGTGGSYTYMFSWTPPAASAGTVMLYVAANCGTGGPAVVPTDVYLSNIKLTPAAASGPSISNVLDAASGRAPVVPGAWAAIYGQGLAGTTRTWQASDFNNGNNLPTSLSGVSVNFGTVPAAVYYISPTQIDVQAPSGISGTSPVTVTYNGATTTSFTATVAQNAPSLFTYDSGPNVYPAATHVNGQIIGDPAVTPGTSKASAGETIVLYVNGIAPSPSGVIVGSPISYSGAVTVNVGSAAGTVTFAGLVAAGEYQVNVTLPAGLAAGNYALTLAAQGQSSQAGVTLPIGP